MELNDISHAKSSGGTTSEDRSRAVKVVLPEEQNNIHNEHGNVSNQTREIEDERTGFIENTGSNSISQEGDVVTFSHFVSKLFPKASCEQTIASEETNDDIPTNIEEYNSSVPFLPQNKRSIPNGCEAGGTWGTTKYHGFNTCMLCVLLTFAGCGPFGFFVVCCPQDRRSAYSVNGKVYDRYGNLIGKEEDLVFHPTIERPGIQTISR